MTVKRNREGAKASRDRSIGGLKDLAAKHNPKGGAGAIGDGGRSSDTGHIGDGGRTTQGVRVGDGGRSVQGGMIGDGG